LEERLTDLKCWEELLTSDILRPPPDNPDKTRIASNQSLNAEGRMARWFDETILIRYWEDRASHYQLKNGSKVERARRNPSFGAYPDVSENFLSDGAVVPAEIEWVTTKFDRHGHDIKTLIDNNGFLVVLKSDASFLVEQIELDRQDFLDWIGKHARELAQETLAEQTEVPKAKRRQRAQATA
jgi:hypothetical protein